MAIHEAVTRNGDVASQIGRVFRYLVFFWAVLAIALPVSAVWAAPFASIVVDARSGETLYEKNADARLHPASLTKMMTLYIAFEELRAGRITLDTKITISKHAASQPPSRLGLKPGQKIALRYLIRAAAVKSANDAATAIGEAIGGSEAEFAKRMTRTAKAIGMTNSTFKNANGLTAPGHLSSARDMNTLGRRLFYDFPEYYNIFSRRTADAGVATVRSTNSRFLDSYKGADGIKTGYTVPAGFNLTASAERGNKRIIATIFGGTSTAQRNAKMAELLDLGFGEAPANAKVQKPAAPQYADDELVALDDGLPENVPGSSAKTVRVSGQVLASLRPKARPGTEPLPEAVTVALAQGIEGALAEATTPPPPKGTLEAQALTLAEGGPPPETPVTEDITVAEVATEEPADLAVAALEPTVDVAVAPAPPAGTLEAQALALADTTAAPAADASGAQAMALADPEAAAGTLDAQPVMLAEAMAEPGDPAMVVASSLRPPSRPASLVPQPEAEIAVAGAASLPDEALVAAPVAEIVVAEAASSDVGTVTDVETVSSAGAMAAPTEAFAALAMPGTTRRAPIFDAVSKPDPAPEQQEVVVAISTSGGSQWGVTVGGFTSHAEAEKAMFKLALAESATLNAGLRKVVQRNDGYAANFLGLSEDQADLACRRLAARAVPCETVGP
jgi:D-alanyl-D-alanine carboxypeptidase